MMKEENLKIYLNQHCKVILVNGWKYQGKILEVNSDVLILDDRFKGRMPLAVQSIIIVEPEVLA